VIRRGKVVKLTLKKPLKEGVTSLLPSKAKKTYTHLILENAALFHLGCGREREAAKAGVKRDSKKGLKGG